ILIHLPDYNMKLDLVDFKIIYYKSFFYFFKSFFIYLSHFLFRCGFLAFERCVMQCRCRLGWTPIIGTDNDAMHHGEMTWARPS
ncbi:MAG: hypothetical protein ACKPKO_51770, partial [Candidatus Fonsibacter sp.]